MPRYYDVYELSDITDESKIKNAIDGNEDYGVDGGFYAGIQLRGKRNSQEDRIIAESLTEDEQEKYRKLDPDQIEELFTETFKTLSESVKSSYQGSTGIAALIDFQSKSCAIINLGDSEIIELVFNNKGYTERNSLYRLNTLHRTDEESEKERLQKEGYNLPANKRFRGTLNVSRAFGDVQYKNSGLSDTPEFKIYKPLLEEGDEIYLIITSDGLTEGAINDYFSAGRGLNYQKIYNKINISRNVGRSFDVLPIVLAKSAIKCSRDNISLQMVKLTHAEQANPITMFAVFDGHFGSDVSQYLKDNFMRVFRDKLKNKILSTPIASLNESPKTILLDPPMPLEPAEPTPDPLSSATNSFLPAFGLSSSSSVSSATKKVDPIPLKSPETRLDPLSSSSTNSFIPALGLLSTSSTNDTSVIINGITHRRLKKKG